MSAFGSVRRNEAKGEVTALIAVPVVFQGTTVAMHVELDVDGVMDFVKALAEAVPEAFEEEAGEPARVLRIVPSKESTP